MTVLQEPVSANTSVKSPQTIRKGLPLGGWLILPALGLIGTPIGLIGNVEDAQQRLQLPSLSETARDYMTLATCLGLIFFALDLFAAYHFFRRRAMAPAVMIFIYVASVVAAFVSASKVYTISGTYNGVPSLVYSLLIAGIWIPYFLRSKRVKQTFVH